MEWKTEIVLKVRVSTMKVLIMNMSFSTKVSKLTCPLSCKMLVQSSTFLQKVHKMSMSFATKGVDNDELLLKYRQPVASQAYILYETLYLSCIIFN